MAGGALQLQCFFGPDRPRRTSTTTTTSDPHATQRVGLLNDWSDTEEGEDGENESGNVRTGVRSFTGYPYNSDVEAVSRVERFSWRCRAKRRRFRSSRCSTFLMVMLLLVGSVWIYYWRKESALRVKWVPDAVTESFSHRPLHLPSHRPLIANYTLPLRTRGRHVIDADGHRFKLASINWYGASDELFVPGGLDIQHRNTIAESIKKLGFNSVRLPYADEVIMKNPVIGAQLVSANPDLVGMRALDIFNAVVTALTDAGIAVIVNNHITSAAWCCGANPCDAAWANDYLGSFCSVKQTEEEWIQHWETIMQPLTDNPLVIGVDLRNEIRGLWGTMPWSKWAPAAEKCGNRLLAMKPSWLVIVEGTESSNDLSHAGERPVQLDVENRLVYSAHVYAWSGWGSTEGRFLQRTYESFAETMRYNWGYLLEGDVAPVWVGEIGSGRSPSVGSANYWQNLMRFLKGVDADFGYWAINPRKPAGNESESYSLVEDDWVTPVLDYRMKDMVDLMSA
ncbi:glycoside hydrolase superfamily [Dactylonectria macrodidyma]|uniref:Glycoside hydrolase superfamily n=1 Tax=Dactylonectria macrodidyma TaxID=307937 RepID=A0A9P9FQZ2_9HYPO|nr:glycoside hydrolase superfamily [Dactylonectria macrodidyma]